jgi:hypothetical protein
MIQCPNPHCGQTVPDFMDECQFCGADLIAVDRPNRKDGETGTGLSHSHIKLIYNMLGLIWIGSAIWDGIQMMVIAPAVAGESLEFGVFEQVIVVMLSLKILFAIGFLAKIEIIRGIVNFFCGLQLVFGLIGLVMSIPLLFFGSFLSTIEMLLSAVIDLGTAAGIIWIIGETDNFQWK